MALCSGKLTYYLLRIMPTGGKSFPGLVFIKIAGKDALNKLAKRQLDMGSVLITGTNGKTTTTTMIINLLSKDWKLSTSVGNNTLFSLTTDLLINKAQLGVYEYGIRDVKHGTPDLVSDYMQPVGVVYTNISREHTQVAGVKNPFEDYLYAKTLLSRSLKKGILITNADDPNVTWIGQNKEKDNTIVYYGFSLENINDLFEINPVKCPYCHEELNYTKHYMGQRGIYDCDCGFRRPEPNVKLTEFIVQDDSWKVTFNLDVYNYNIKSNILEDITLNLPVVGIHNLYNILCAITTYAAFSTGENIKENIIEYYSNYDFEVPPGRFEILDVDNKIVGVGQGDNGDALKVNSLLMTNYVDEELEFIYCTPDANEEEIFEDHLLSINSLNPDNLIVIPGRTSVDAAKDYYNIIEKQYDSTFIPLEFDFEERINKIVDLVKNSNYKNIIISGCGEEIYFWDYLKKKLQE